MKLSTLHILLTAGVAFSQDAADTTTPDYAWHIDLTSNLTLTANTYSKNWTGGENGSFTYVAQLKSLIERQFNQYVLNKNTIKLEYGQTAIQEKDSTGAAGSWSPPEKSTDLIDMEALVQFTLQSWVDPFVGVRLISQFLDAGDPTNERYGNPLEITESFGAARALVKNPRLKWNARLGGAVRQTIDRDARNTETTGSAYETDVTNDGGVEMVMDLITSNKDEWWKLASNLKVYEALVSSENEESTTDDWRYPDVNWENSLTVNFTKYIMLNLTLQMLYDKEIHENVRIKETFSAGLTFNFKR